LQLQLHAALCVLPCLLHSFQGLAFAAQVLELVLTGCLVISARCLWACCSAWW
jgi:hypothetical protein